MAALAGDMRRVISLLPLLMLFPLVLLPGACSTAADSDGGADAGPNKTDDPDCQPATCSKDQCGIDSDGCGGTLDCGSCSDDQCIPRSCQAEDCGPTSDGCGGSVDCGACQTCQDDGIAGDSASSAAHLGTYTDNSGTTGSVSDLTLSSGEEDWFVLGVEDACCIGNPKPGVGVDASSSSADITVFVTYLCTNATVPSYQCEGGTFDTSLNGCVLTAPAGSSDSFMSLASLNCGGADEGGTAIIRVTSAGADCQAYDLLYEVTK